MLKLAPTLRTLPRLVKEANGTAAFFTSVPTSFAPFGFDAGWDAFEAFSPVKDLAASEPFTRATSWLGRELDERPLARHLVVIHSRGAHARGSAAPAPARLQRRDRAAPCRRDPRRAARAHGVEEAP